MSSALACLDARCCGCVSEVKRAFLPHSTLRNWVAGIAGGVKGPSPKPGAAGAGKAAAPQLRPFMVSPSMDHIVKLHPSASQDSISSLETTLSNADSISFGSGRHSSHLLPRSWRETP